MSRRRYTRHLDEFAPDGEYRGYYWLVLAIIADALNQSAKGDKTERDAAREFIVSSDFDSWCYWIDVDPDAIRRRITRI